MSGCIIYLQIDRASCTPSHVTFATDAQHGAPSAVVRGIRRVINQKIKNKTMRNRSKIAIFKNGRIGLDE